MLSSLGNVKNNPVAYVLLLRRLGAKGSYQRPCIRSEEKMIAGDNRGELDFKGESKQMKFLIDKQNRPWLYALIAVGFVFLLAGLGLGVRASHGGLSRVEARYPFSNAAAQEPKPMTTAQGLPDFVALAKNSSQRL
jgi:hypothetical protein